MLTAARRRLATIRVASARDAGITLVELVVTMSLMSIVGAMALTWFVGSSNASQRTIDDGQTAAGPRTTMNAWAALLQVAHVDPQSAPPATSRIVTVTPTSITFNADLDNRPTCSSAPCTLGAATRVTLAIVTDPADPTNKQLVQRIGPQRLVQVAKGAASSGCLFTPYTAAGTPLGCNDQLTVGQLAAIARIDISFTVTPSLAAVQTYKTSAAIPGGTS